MPKAEKRLLWVLGAIAVYMPWAVGSSPPSTQWPAFGLAFVAFVMALLPRIQDEALGLERNQRSGWSRLRRFPFFWLGIALFGYITIQALNPLWVYETNGQMFWLRRLHPVEALPSGISAPFARMSPGREIVIYGTAWMTACAAWAGITRRRSLRVLGYVLAANVVAIATVMWVQQISGEPYLPWTPRKLVSTFIYKNHAGAYLALASFSLLALAATENDRRDRGSVKSSPALLYVFAALYVAGAVVFTLSRTATALLGLGFVAAVIWYVLRRRKLGRSSNPWLLVAPATVLGGFILFAGASLDFSEAIARFSRAITNPMGDISFTQRNTLRTATLEMWADHRLYGVGAGGFRHLIPEYTEKYPDIRTFEGKYITWEYAHCDWIELPTELGVVGFSIFVAGLVWWFAYLWKRRGSWINPWTLLLIGLFGTMLHAAYDFPFQNMAILMTWSLLAVMVSKAMEWERRG